MNNFLSMLSILHNCTGWEYTSAHSSRPLNSHDDGLASEERSRHQRQEQSMYQTCSWHANSFDHQLQWHSN